MKNKLIGGGCIFIWCVLFHAAQIRAIAAVKENHDILFCLGVVALLFIDISLLLDVAGFFCSCGKAREELRQWMAGREFVVEKSAYVRLYGGLLCMCVSSFACYKGIDRVFILAEVALASCAWLKFGLLVIPRDLFVERFSIGKPNYYHSVDRFFVGCVLCFVLCMLLEIHIIGMQA